MRLAGDTRVPPVIPCCRRKAGFRLRGIPREVEVSGASKDTVFIISSDRLGHGSEELGAQLMAKFVQQLATLPDKPHAIVLYNGGVRLLTADSPCVEGFRHLEHDGTDLLACGTCVDFYQLRERIAAGHVTDMRAIVAAIQAAPKVVTV